MSGGPRLASARGEPLAIPLWPGVDGRPAPRRRAALGLALLVLAVLAFLAATGAIGLPGTGSATAGPGPDASPRTAATEGERARPEAQPPVGKHASEARPASDRVVAPRHAAALFAQHSWYVVPPAPPPAAPPPPPPPTAPPFPYTLIGSYSPEGDPPVFFLARGDRVIDAHVGDRLDGVYQFESASGGQLVFVYLPLDVRQRIPTGAPK